MINPSDLTGFIPRLSKRRNFKIPKLIVLGIGNPETDYHSTRHNVGLWAIKTIIDKYQLDLNSNKRTYDSWIGKLYGETIVIGKSKTYMNNSGLAARALLKDYKAAPNCLLVIYDDMDIAPGNIRLKKQGSPGGHNGMKSIQEYIGTSDFPRLRIGIGRPKKSTSGADHVLDNFSVEEIEDVKKISKKIIDHISILINKDLDLFSSKINQQ